MCAVAGWESKDLPGAPEILVFGSPWSVEGDFSKSGGEGHGMSVTRWCTPFGTGSKAGLGQADLVVARPQAVDRQSHSIATQKAYRQLWRCIGTDESMTDRNSGRRMGLASG